MQTGCHLIVKTLLRFSHDRARNITGGVESTARHCAAISLESYIVEATVNIIAGLLYESPLASQTRQH
jgi:hypothetical protein